MEYLRSIPAFVWLLLSALVFACGEYLSKEWATRPSWGFAFVVCATYAFCSLLWLPVMIHRADLTLMGMAWLLLGTLATVFVGVIIFHEPIALYQWAGIALSVLALAFLSL